MNRLNPSYKVTVPAIFSWLATITMMPQFVVAQVTVPVSASTRQTPQAVIDGTARLVGRYGSNQKLRLVFGLQPPHQDEEEQFLRDLHTKGSPQFHRFLTADEWNARFAPAASDEQAVVDWAEGQGLVVTHRFPNRLLVDVEGSAGTIEKALHVTLNSYQIGADVFFSNDRDPVLPAGLAGIVHSVQGLNNLQVLHPPGTTASHFPAYTPGPPVTLGIHREAHGDRSKLPQRRNGSHQNGTLPGITSGSYDPTDLYSSEAYDYTALSNLGHCCNPLGNPYNSPPEASIAIVSAGLLDANDIAGFQFQYPYLAYNFQSIFVDGTPTGPDVEGTADTEWAIATANSFISPASTAAVYLYEGPNSQLSTFTDIFNQILTDGKARVLTTSWGCAELYCYDTLTMDTDHAIFNQMVGQGWTLVAASGDSGATADCVHQGVSYPASDPDVIAAGGTSLTLNSDSSFSNETGWTGGTTAGSCMSHNGGSGGGVSAYYATPKYQIGMAGGTGYRSVPDLALNASYPQNIVYQGQLQGFGGTSLVAPELAGFFAQENAYLLTLGSICGANGQTPCAPMGNANYPLYKEGTSAPYALHYPFYDILSGCNSNDVTAAGGIAYFCAAAGYDRVTGWGSANMLQLAWAINTDLAGDFGGPAITFTGPPVNQWYNADQTVSWSIADTSGNTQPPNGVSGYSQAWDVVTNNVYQQSTPGSGNFFYDGPQFPFTDGSLNLADTGLQGCHTAHVQAWDNAGVPSGDVTYGPLCYDTVPPVTSATLTPPANTAGWNNSTVQVSLSASDPGSGFGQGSGVSTVYESLDNPACSPAALASCLVYPGPLTITAPGSHTIYVFSKDRAGNFGPQQGSAVNIDEAAPHTTATLSGTLNGLVYLGAVQVTLSGSDDLSGIASTVYQVDGGTQQTYSAPFSVSSTGSHTILFHSIDKAGNTEGNQSVSFAVSAAYLISGQVTLSGTGLGNVAVALTGSQNGSTSTDPFGNFTFIVLPAGNYTVAPTLAGYKFSPPGRSFFNLTSNQTASFTASVSVPTYTISGQVTLSGSALPGVTVTLSGSQSSAAITDSSGNYSLTAPSGGSYIVTPSLNPYNFIPSSLTFSSLSGNQTASFAVAPPPPAPALVSPVNGAGGVGQTTTLTWTAANSATSYDVYVGTTFPPPLAGNTTGTTFNAPGLNSNTNYYWSVTAKSGNGSTASPIWSFGTALCSMNLNPAAAYFDANGAPAAQVTVSATPANCNWVAAAGGGFINITSGANGTGNGLVTYSMAANTTGADLVGSLTIGGQVVPITERQTATIFTDVSDPSAYYFDGANLMYARGITNGCLASPLMFCPDQNLTRGQMAVFLVRSVLGGDNFTYSPTPYFTDVPPTYPFFQWIQKLKELQITNGCTPTTYCPDNTVTRGQTAAFIIRARYGPTATFSYPSTPYFADVPSTDPFFSYIQKMAQVGITNGCSATDFCPNDVLTRGQIAVFDMRGLFNQLLPAGAPVLTVANPNSAGVGQTLTITLTGVNTHFFGGSTVITTAPGISASNVLVTSGTSLTVQLAVDPSAILGPYSLVATTGTEEAVLPNGFTVQ